MQTHHYTPLALDSGAGSFVSGRGSVGRGGHQPMSSLPAQLSHTHYGQGSFGSSVRELSRPTYLEPPPSGWTPGPELLPGGSVHGSGYGDPYGAAESSTEVPPSWADVNAWDETKAVREEWQQELRSLAASSRTQSFRSEAGAGGAGFGRYSSWRGPLPPSDLTLRQPKYRAPPPKPGVSPFFGADQVETGMVPAGPSSSSRKGAASSSKGAATSGAVASPSAALPRGESVDSDDSQDSEKGKEAVRQVEQAIQKEKVDVFQGLKPDPVREDKKSLVLPSQELKKVLSVRPGATSTWQVGKDRLRLRQAFNREEISTTKIMKEYDVDGNGVLEKDEIHNMLQNYQTWKRKPTDDEFEMLMAVADTDEDEMIETNEVIYALKVWYAYTRMPRSANRVITSISGMHVPSTDILKTALTTMNENYPVGEEEVAHVRLCAQFLAGTTTKVDLAQMRMAVATWYLNVERSATPQAHIINHAVKSAHEKVRGASPIVRMLKGQCDIFTLITSAVAVFAFVIMPCLEITVARKFPVMVYRCHMPLIDNVLEWTGYLTWFWLAVYIVFAIVWEYDWCPASSAKFYTGAALGFATFICVLNWAFGVYNTLEATAGGCGIILYQTCTLTFMGLPAMCLMFGFCGLPCLYCAEIMYHQRLEEDLQH